MYSSVEVIIGKRFFLKGRHRCGGTLACSCVMFEYLCLGDLVLGKLGPEARREREREEGREGGKGNRENASLDMDVLDTNGTGDFWGRVRRGTKTKTWGKPTCMHPCCTDTAVDLGDRWETPTFINHYGNRFGNYCGRVNSSKWLKRCDEKHYALDRCLRHRVSARHRRKPTSLSSTSSLHGSTPVTTTAAISPEVAMRSSLRELYRFVRYMKSPQQNVLGADYSHTAYSKFLPREEGARERSSWEF